jgi:hypothetical protein
MPGIVRCRKCGERIGFEPRPGFVVKGEPRYFPVNANDRKPHFTRCRINQDLAAARAAAKPQPKPKAAPICQPQGEMFK